MLQLVAKALLQLAALLWALLVALPRPDVILLQLPPALPTMLACRLAAMRHRARLVYDWHNFAFTLMAIGMGRGHPLVRRACLRVGVRAAGRSMWRTASVLGGHAWPVWEAGRRAGAPRPRCASPCRAPAMHALALALLARPPARSPARQVRAAEGYERLWGRAAHASLCVTRAMQRELAKSWRVPATVFYDRPPDFFRPASLQARPRCRPLAGWLGCCGRRAPCAVPCRNAAAHQVSALARPATPGFTARPQEKHALLRKLQPELAAALHPADFCAELYASGRLGPGDTLCTTSSGGGAVRERPGRPALVVSSTSWTPDEDFGLLLRAAEVGRGIVSRLVLRAAEVGGAGVWGLLLGASECSWLLLPGGRSGCMRGGARASPDRWHPGLCVQSAGRHTPHHALPCHATPRTPPLPGPQLYDARAQRSRHPGRYPRILFLVTGRGPQRAEYEQRMRALDLRHVAFRRAPQSAAQPCRARPCRARTGADVRAQGAGAAVRAAPLAAQPTPLLPRPVLRPTPSLRRPPAAHAGRCGWSPGTTRCCWGRQTWASACTPPPPASTCP